MQALLDAILSRLQATFDPAAIGAGLAGLLVNVTVGLAIYVVFYVVWRLLRLLLRPALRRGGMDETAAIFVETLTKYSVLVLGLVTALDAVGIQTSAVLTSLGIVGLTIGFAARDALSNLISGLLIFLDRPFVLGDLVEIEGVYGRVDKITLRSTRVVTSDGRMLAVPNTEVINKTVASYTNFPHLRLDIRVTVAVTENLARVRQVLLNLVQGSDEFLTTPPARVVVTQLNDYNVALELRVWLKDERQHVEKRFELREQVFNALNQAGVEMPLETIQLAPMQVAMQQG